MSTPDGTTPAPAPAAAPAAAAGSPAPASAAAPAAASKPALPPPLVAPVPKDAPADAQAGEKAPAAAAPVEVDFPEGFPEVAAASIKGLAADLGLDKAKAGKLVERYVEAQKQLDAQREESFAKQAHEYVAQAEKHQAVVALGGLDKARALAGKALTTFGSPAMGELLQATGLAYHPEVLAFFAGLGARLGEGSVSGAVGQPTAPALTPEQELREIYNHPTSASMWAKG